MIGAVTKFKETKIAERLRGFFMGPIYPALVCLIALFGHVFAIEFYLNIVNMLLISIGLAVCTSLRPAIVVLCTFTYQISVKNTPGEPTWSDYYFTDGRSVVIVALFVIVAIALLFFFISNGLFTKKRLLSLPHGISFPILTLAFLLSGVSSPAWTPGDLGYAAVQVVCLYIVFYLLYLGLSGENMHELAEYFAYVCALITFLLVGEMINAFITSDSAIVDGSINRNIFALGWGISNVLGMNLVSLLPMLFYGVIRSKRPITYFLIAVLNYVAVLVVLSRNSMLFGSIIFAVCLIISCFFGERRRLCRILSAALLTVALVVSIFLLDEILLLLQRYVTSGFSDSGRFDLWRFGFDSFLEYPLFGKGFFGMEVPLTDMAEFLPNMVHNTLFQLLGATGIFGTLAYALYRLETLVPFFRRPTLEKTLLGICASTVVLESLLDNFIFYMQTTFVYAVALAIAFLIYDGDRTENNRPIDARISVWTGRGRCGAKQKSE